MTYTDAEREDARYEMWLLDDGPAKVTERERVKALASIDNDIKPAGWEVLKSDLVKPTGEDAAKMQCTVQRGNRVKIIRWSGSSVMNRWMVLEQDGGWWTLWDPK
jgi:hypothetical protein